MGMTTIERDQREESTNNPNSSKQTELVRQAESTLFHVPLYILKLLGDQF